MTSIGLDQQLIAAATSGDAAAFSALAERHRAELQVHAYRMLGSLDDAQDAVHDALLRAWRSRGTYDGRWTFRAWLYRIATNRFFGIVIQDGDGTTSQNRISGARSGSASSPVGPTRSACCAAITSPRPRSHPFARSSAGGSPQPRS